MRLDRATPCGRRGARHALHARRLRVARLVTMAAALALLLLSSPRALAHSTTYAVYSKYEGTVRDRGVAFVFALDKTAVTQLVERDVAHGPVAPEALAEHRAWFSTYLFARFSVSNDGAICTHPAELGKFGWDERTGRVLAVTKFVCPTEPRELTIRSLVTHDMPIAHELVGDLRFGRALVRSFFTGDDVEAQIALPSLPQREDAPVARNPHSRGRYLTATEPDRVRRYDDLADAELASAPADAVDVHPGRTFLHFVGQGMFHIFTGYDHILFIVTLMLAVATMRQLAAIVTSFTAAHSITLILSTLGVVVLPARVIEPLIAASVLFVAIDAIARPQASARAVVTFAFGLVHGFGLSNVLRELGLSGRELVPALLGFNVGVEVGQLLIVLPLFPLVLLLRKRPAMYARARSAMCASVAVVAVFWIVARVWQGA